MAVLKILQAEGATPPQIEQLNSALENILSWFEVKAPNARISIGLAFELAGHMIFRGYDVWLILDEISILEGTSARKSITKPAKRFYRNPLKGLWHKHHFQATFMPENILLELDRPNVLSELTDKFIGQTVGDVASELSAALVDGAFSRRASRNSLTGEFIVYEKIQDCASYYLTLGSHDEYENIAKRVRQYKILDLENRNNGECNSL